MSHIPHEIRRGTSTFPEYVDTFFRDMLYDGVFGSIPAIFRQVIQENAAKSGVSKRGDTQGQNCAALANQKMNWGRYYPITMEVAERSSKEICSSKRSETNENSGDGVQTFSSKIEPCTYAVRVPVFHEIRAGRRQDSALLFVR